MQYSTLIPVFYVVIVSWGVCGTFCYITLKKKGYPERTCLSYGALGLLFGYILGIIAIAKKKYNATENISADNLQLIEKLAEFRDKGIINESEFAHKKAELFQNKGLLNSKSIFDEPVKKNVVLIWILKIAVCSIFYLWLRYTAYDNDWTYIWLAITDIILLIIFRKNLDTKFLALVLVLLIYLLPYTRSSWVLSIFGEGQDVSMNGMLSCLGQWAAIILTALLFIVANTHCFSRLKSWITNNWWLPATICLLSYRDYLGLANWFYEILEYGDYYNSSYYIIIVLIRTILYSSSWYFTSYILSHKTNFKVTIPTKPENFQQN